MERDYTSPEYVGEILDTVTNKVPRMIKDIISTLYSPESGQSMGKAVGALYKELIEAGIPNEDALEMAKDYMLSLSKITDSINMK